MHVCVYVFGGNNNVLLDVREEFFETGSGLGLSR